jgi:hypothetical protein
MATLTFACDPAIVAGHSTITVTLQPTRPRIKTKAELEGFTGKPVDEVEQGVRDWCAALGIPVPPEELEACGIIHATAAAEEAATVAAVAASTIELKPEFGTPEFWAWARKRRNEKNAERAAAGLPPLLTAAQKAVAKAKKDAEKASKKATMDVQAK